jgi:dihydroxyacetone kinase
MTRIFDNPAEFMDDMLRGFCALYPQYVTSVEGGVVRADETMPGKVAVVVGGGSGHYPAFCGIVGPGFADGAVVGNVFTSPSAQDAINVGAAADNGGGVVITSGNYAGDVLHFTEAAEFLSKSGIPSRTVFVTDDIASAPRGEEAKRRGIAGDFVVFKVMSAAAEKGYDLDAVVGVGEKANSLTRTLGVAFSGCTLPGGEQPLFTVPEGKMGVGLGIHGEPGVSEEPIPTARELARRLVDETVAELPLAPGSKVGVILNGLGASKYEELFVLWASVSEFLEEKNLEIIHPEVGELVTSLDMAGISLTLVALDDELEEFWKSGADTPAYRKGSAEVRSAGPSLRSVRKIAHNDVEKIEPASASSQAYASRLVTMFDAITQTIIDAETELGRIDAVAGDGDHGRGMVKGAEAASAAVGHAVESGAGIRQALVLAGDAWAAKAGGTSGALWGAALKAVGTALGDPEGNLSTESIVSAVEDSLQAIVSLGKASLGDKTMVDSLVPFVQELREGTNRGDDLGSSWRAAALLAEQAARDTAMLSPKVGRARPLAERSVGTPDAGATSLALILVALAPFFGSEE